MAKDPAFLFYSSDFTVGTQFFTAEQVGIYIRLLCAQHQHGRLYEHHMKIICGSYDFHSELLSVVREKFLVDEEGRFYNERLDQETKKRAAYSKSRGENRAKGLKKKQLGNLEDVHHMNIICESYEHHMENENENINKEVIVIKKTKKDKPKLELTFPCPEMEGVWLSWIDYQKSEHKNAYKSSNTAQVAINNLWALSGHNPTTAQEIIHQSIGNRWKGFFQLKTQNGQHATTTGSLFAGENKLGTSAARIEAVKKW